MNHASIRRPRRSGIAFVATLFILGSLLGGVAQARSSSVRKYVPSISPTCAPNSSNVQFTATITNDSSSNQVLGSALFHSSVSNFHNIYSSSFSTPVASGGKSWQVIRDVVDADGIYLRAATSNDALSPGESVSVLFTATTPSSTGNKTWSTYAWQSTIFLGSSFSLASGASKPVVQVANACVGPPANISFFAGPSDTAAGSTMADVKVKVTDAANNPVSGESVTLASAGLASSPTAPKTTGSDGIATFSGIAVKTAAGPYTMTASDAAASLTTDPAPFNITPGPFSITFNKQPTNTLVNLPIGGGDVEVTVKDAYGNPAPDTTSVVMTIGVDPTGSATLGGTKTQNTSSGVATFSDLTINMTSSGYKLMATSDSLQMNSDPFAITNTDNDCNPCTATFPNGTSTVSAPAGTTLIIETNQLDCSGVGTPIAGTVTIIPSGSGPIPVSFTDTITLPVTGPYPFCKSPPDPAEIVPLCNTLDGNGLDNDPEGVPCVTESVEFIGDPHAAILHSVLWINQYDPIGRH